jgi:cytochrome b561
MKSYSPSQFVAVYHPVLRTLHWLMALLIFCALGLGVWATQLPRGAVRGEVLFVHKSIGVAVLALMVIRIVARLALGSPAYAAALGRLTHAAAHAAHILLYALMIALPVSGYLTSSAGGHEVSFFGLFSLPNLVGENKALDEGASQAHYVFAWMIGVVLVLHLLAVAWHARIKRDTVLTRMWPRFQPLARLS